MDHDEMTIADILNDPLVRQMMRADRVSLREMKKLLLDAARCQRISRQRSSYPETIGRPPCQQSA